VPEKEYIVFCDESEKHGQFFSNFYGGVLVGASQYMAVTKRLNTLKQRLNFFGETKWEKVSCRYLDKYIALVRGFFKELRRGTIKVRIMFTQNALVPKGLTPEHQEHEYFLLYYQFIKHAFGLRYCPAKPDHTTAVRVYMDELPDNREKRARFKAYLHALQESTIFARRGLTIREEDIAEVRSHDHVLLQCVDIVLGAMAFRLNDRHKAKPPGRRRRGKRTVAKESLYKVIYAEIREIYPGFNVGMTTGRKGGPEDVWRHPYRHWLFRPAEFDYDGNRTKRKQKPRRAY